MKKLLIVDDIEDNRLIIRDWLEDDFEISEACDGKEALEMIKNNAYDLVLLDLSLPEIGGMDIIKIIRQDPKLKSLPVVAVTAYLKEDEKEEALKNGFDRFLPKPFRFNDLKSMIDDLMS